MLVCHWWLQLVSFCIHLQQIIVLMGLNVFSLLFGFSALLANSLASIEPVALRTSQQVTLLV